VQHPVNKPSLSFWAEFLQDLRLAWRLLRERRMPLWTKAVPLLVALYLLWPVDLLADPFLGLGQLDDLAVLLVAVELFIALAPTPLRDELAGSPTGKVMRDPWWPLPVEGQAVDVSEGQTHLLSTEPPVQ